MVAAWKAAGLTFVHKLSRSSICLLMENNSYNMYLAIAARVVRRSLKEQPRLAAERRGQMQLKFAKWEVCLKIWFVEAFRH